MAAKSATAALSVAAVAAQSMLSARNVFSTQVASPVGTAGLRYDEITVSTATAAPVHVVPVDATSSVSGPSAAHPRPKRLVQGATSAS